MTEEIERQEQMLLERYGPTLDLVQVGEVTHQAAKTIHNQISAGRFPIRTFRVPGSKKRLASVFDVAKYLAQLICDAGD